MKRQFIAGATCPSCGALDRIQRCAEGEKTWMECVACGLIRDLDEPAPEASDAHEQSVTLQPAKK